MKKLEIVSVAVPIHQSNRVSYTHTAQNDINYYLRISFRSNKAYTQHHMLKKQMKEEKNFRIIGHK